MSLTTEIDSHLLDDETLTRFRVFRSMSNSACCCALFVVVFIKKGLFYILGGVIRE